MSQHSKDEQLSYFHIDQPRYMQARKRHWGCDACDTLFNSVLELEEHKEEMEHWSDDEYESDGDDEEDDEEEECDCGCSSPPRILSSVGVGTEETVFTE